VRIEPASGAAQDFSGPVSYTVTAVDGSAAAYTVTVSAASIDSKEITLFEFRGLTPPVTGTITGTDIAVTVPHGTDLTGLAPTITHTGAGIEPASGAARDFTGPVSYTVTAADDSTQVYTVTVSAAPPPGSAKEITAFVFNGLTPPVTGTITGTDIAVTVPSGTVLTGLVPTVTHTGAGIEPASGAAQDFTGPVSYTVTAEDETTQVYTVRVSAAAAVLTSIEAVEDYLEAVSGGSGAADPVPLAVSLSLSAYNWTDLLGAIAAAGRYVSLDLSACTGGGHSTGGGLYAGNIFDPGNTVSTGKDRIVSLVLPAGAAGMGDIFNDFTNLKSLSGAGITAVDGPIFSRCTALETVSLPAATSIGIAAFEYCTALKTLSLPAVTSIGIAAFEGCTDLSSVSLPAITSIGYNTFWDCTDLRTLSLPAGLTSVSGNPFAGCTRLTSITVDPGNPSYKAEDGKLLNKAGTALIAYPSASGPVTLNGITAIGDYAFSGCAALETVSAPAATSIGDYAFFRCAALETLSAPAAISIGDTAFSRCDALTTVSAPAATSIGSSAFYGCTALPSISLPAATSIDAYAFSYCTALTTVNLPAAVSIGSSAFTYCTALETLSLPVATSIGNSAFNDCALETLSLPKATSIGNRAFASCTALTTVTLPVATSIDGWAFNYCLALETLSLPVATSIGEYAFRLTALETLSLPKAVTIGGYAFETCTALTTASLPAATSIGDHAFYNCSALETLNLPVVASIGEYAFDYTRAEALTLTLGATPPAVEAPTFSTMTPAMTVIVKVPAGATGYGTIPAAYTTDTATQNWANAFRGMGWSSTGGYGAGTVNTNITLNIQYLTP
jgi:hypothetical protein